VQVTIASFKVKPFL